MSLLDPLLNAVDEDELRVIEEIVRERDELAVYSNLSQRLEANRSDPNAAGAVERRGLAWIMALARVELGAMAAGFTEHPEPFAMIAPSRYEASAYLELLFDGARTHALALGNDPVAQYYASMRGRSVTVAEAVYGPEARSPLRRGNQQLALANESRAIAYARRVAVADEFLQAAAKFGASQLAPVQQSELAAYREQLRTLQDVLLYKVLGLGASETTLSASRTTRSEQGASPFRACPRLMQIARRDVAAGRAQFETFEERGSSTTTTIGNQ